jgi:hypothetical protein
MAHTRSRKFIYIKYIIIIFYINILETIAELSLMTSSRDLIVETLNKVLNETDFSEYDSKNKNSRVVLQEEMEKLGKS